MKTVKLKAKLTFIIPAIAVFLISLSSCTKKSADSEDLINNSNDKSLASLAANTMTTTGITVNVKTVGAVGDGTTDDTWAFNEAIDQVATAGGGTVYVPLGTYLINPDVSIIMKSNVFLDMVDTLRNIKVKPSALQRYNVIRMHKVTNAKIKGGKIFGERYQHLGTGGEWGMGISLYEATNCRVDRTVITDCWGDGIVVGAQSIYNATNPSQNVVIKEVRSRNNRRQGLTIGAADSVIVSYCKFMSTNGTAPQAGIDIEPDNLQATKIYIQNCEVGHNAGVGVLMYKNTALTSLISTVRVEGNNIHHNGSYAGWMQRVDNVKFFYNLIQNNGNNGFNILQSTNVVTTPNTY